MRKQLLPYLAIILGVTALLSTGCNKYARLARSRKLSDRDSAAVFYYNKRQYDAASTLFEELMNAYRGNPRAERITYFYAQAKFRLKDYVTSGHYFQQLADQYPNGRYTEEALFMVGYSAFKLSNDYEHDQGDNAKAMESFQVFLSIYPNSDRRYLVNEYVAELRDRQAHKAFNYANLYFNIGHYRAATLACKNMMVDFPDSKYREEVQFKLFKASVLFAAQSIESKREQRYLEALSYYNRFRERYPDSKFNRQVQNLYEDTEKALKKLSGSTASVQAPQP